MAVNQEIKILFTVDDSQLEGAKKSTVDLGNAVEVDKKKYKELADIIEKEVAAELKAAGVVAGQFGKQITDGTKQATTGVKSLRAELAAAKQAAVDAAAKFGESSVEFRNAASRAGELKAQLGDLNQTLDALDPDAKAKAFSQVGQAAFGAFQVATGALQAFGVENEKVNKLAQQFQGLLNVTQGLSQLGQLSDSLKNVATVLGFTTTAQKAATVATEVDATAKLADAAATDVATVSTKAFSAALLTSPLVIFAAAAAAIAGAIYLVDEANEEAIESSIRLQKKFADLAAADLTYYKKIGELIDENAAKKQFEIDLASAQGQSQDKIIQLEIEKQRQIEKTLALAIESGRLDGDNLKEAVAQRTIAGREIQVNEAKLTTFLKNEAIKRGEEAVKAEKKAREKIEADRKKAEADRIAAEKAEQDRLAGLKKQFEEELSTQTKAIDDDLALKRIINAERYFGKEKELKLADIVAEEESIQAKIELNKVFGLDTSTEQQKLYAQLALLRKQYDATNKEGNKTALQSFLADNQKIIEAALEAYSALSNAFLDITSAQTEAQIESLNAQFDADREGTQQLLDDKRISQKQYDDSIAALEKKKEQEIKKLQREQAIREKALAIFNASLVGSLAILNAFAAIPFNPAIIVLTAATVAAQIAAIAAAPIPKFAKGTLNVGGGQEGTDSVHAMLMPGEAVIPTSVNRKYKEPIKAIFHESVGADELTQFIQMTPNMRYALLMAAGEQFNESIVNKPTNISTAQIMNSYITQAVRGSSRSSGSGRSTPVNVDMSGVERSIRNNKTVKLDNTKQLAQQIAASITDSMNIRRKW